MKPYVDGFLLAVPKKNLKKYEKMATLSSKIWLDHGALQYVECVADDVQKGKITSFPQAVKLKAGEVVIFAYATYKSRKDRDRVMKKVMADPRMIEAFGPEGENMPFDGMRMMWGGFKCIINAEK